MSVPASTAGFKRKASGSAGAPNRIYDRKRQKIHEAHNIATQTADAALTKNGELNIAKFIGAREFEINSMKKSMGLSRQALSLRAFQSVPRHLRRRTASHNVKKVPKRLRQRARREMTEDNTPTVNARTRTPSSKLRLRLETAKALKRLNSKRKSLKQKKNETGIDSKETDPAKHVAVSRVPRIKKNRLANPPLATSRFKKRQVDKTWLPTHLWHSKRARMTRPTEPLWRMAIPLSPTEKSYRPSHRAAGARGSVAWDTSYVSSIGCRGTEKALESLLKAIKFTGEGWSGLRYTKWKAGTRFASSWTCERDNPERFIAPIDVVWLPATVASIGEPATEEKTDVEMTEADQSVNKSKKTKLTWKLLIRTHPSAFYQFWCELIKVAKLQKPQVLVEDLRFEIGSIQITGPGSTESLLGVLRPSDPKTRSAHIWNTLSCLTTPTSLPVNVSLAFNVDDPRLNHPPSQVKMPGGQDENMALVELLSDWPGDRDYEASLLFDNQARYLANRVSSQKAINRRKASLLPGQALQSSSKDPKIPVMLHAHRTRSSRTNVQGSWTLMAPWKCIDLIWRSLMYYPLRAGRTPRFGGLQEMQQIAFERAIPWFPGDYPGTEAGQAWERTQSEQQFDRWIRRPPSRRLAYDTIDLGLGRRGEIGRGWACDWEYLVQESAPKKDSRNKSTKDLSKQATKAGTPLLTQRQRKAAKAKIAVEREKQARRRNTSSPESNADEELEKSELVAPLELSQSQFSDTIRISKNLLNSTLPNIPSVATIKFTLLTRGTPSRAARIYRLPEPKDLQTENKAPQGDEVKAQRLMTSSENITPPAAQPSPPTLSSLASSDSPAQSSDLRARWLGIDQPVNHGPINQGITTKERINHHSLPRKHKALPAESLSHINVLPPNAPQEVIDQYGPKPPTEEEIQKAVEDECKIRLEEEKVWDIHIPCPNEEDLIGFVTSGGYNLTEGKGTGIGSIWLQRLFEGWIEEDQKQKERDDGQTPLHPPQKPESTVPTTSTSTPSEESSDAKLTNTTTNKPPSNLPHHHQQGNRGDPGAQSANPSPNPAGAVAATATDKISRHDKHKQKQKNKAREKQKLRERHLCIVRNAGESVGRLATWEFCE